MKKHEEKLFNKIYYYVREYGSVQLEVEHNKTLSINDDSYDRKYGLRLIKNDGSCKIRYYHMFKGDYVRRYNASCFFEDVKHYLNAIRPSHKGNPPLATLIRCMILHDRNDNLKITGIRYGEKYQLRKKI